jgi:hypothetical protein
MRRISRETSGTEAHNEPHAYLEFICGARHFLGISKNGPPRRLDMENQLIAKAA